MGRFWGEMMPCKAQAKNAKTSHSWAGLCLAHFEGFYCLLRLFASQQLFLNILHSSKDALVRLWVSSLT